MTAFATSEDDEALAKAVLNPLKVNHYTKHISAPFDNDIYFGYGPSNEYQNILNFKPVIPFRLTSNS